MLHLLLRDGGTRVREEKKKGKRKEIARKQRLAEFTSLLLPMSQDRAVQRLVCGAAKKKEGVQTVRST